MRRIDTDPVHMVSQPQTSGIYTHRPASESSRSVTSRRHRNSHSHSGGTSYRPQNEFPNFAQTGDVEIIVNADGQEKRYLLHRLILAQCSGFFEAGTSQDWSRAQARAQSSGSGSGNGSSILGRISEDEEAGRGTGRPPFSGAQTGGVRWRYELDRGNKDEELPMLVQKVRI